MSVYIDHSQKIPVLNTSCQYFAKQVCLQLIPENALGREDCLAVNSGRQASNVQLLSVTKRVEMITEQSIFTEWWTVDVYDH